MRNVLTIAAAATVFGSSLLMIQRHQGADGYSEKSVLKAQLTSGLETAPQIIRAPGRIEGRTETVELRARIAEQIREIHVDLGEWVSAGDLLVSLDSDRFQGERDLAEALVAEARAKKLRLENGFRESEIAAAREEFEAAKAQLQGAEKRHARGKRLVGGDAISEQALDDLLTNVQTWRANAAAAKQRLETMELPARADELLAASAAVRAAEARLKIAQIQLDRCQIEAPASGKVLAIEAELGELTGPDVVEPLVIMADTRNLRALAEIDEYDALQVRVGQQAEITADGADGVIARGSIVEIEPQMNRKRVFGQWAGERTDTHTRRVWIGLTTEQDLPIGLPVDVYVDVDSNPQSAAP